MRRTSTWAVAALLLAGALAAGSAPLDAAQAVPAVGLDPVSAPAGAAVTASGSGFEASGTMSLFLDEVVVGTELATTTLRSSSFALSFTVPQVPTGRHVVLACREPLRTGECRQVARAVLDVVRPAATTTTSRPRPPETPPPQVGVTTTLPPPSVPDVLVGSTTTTLPGQLGITTTTVEGSPPSSEGPTGFQVTSTIATPGGLAGGELGDVDNLAVTDVEVSQGLQNLDNEFPLVTNRRTTLRVYGVSENPEGQGYVGAAVAGFRVDGGDEVPLGIEWSENVAVFDDSGLHRGSHEHVPYIELPWSWAEGTVKLRVWVFAGEVLAGNEADTTDNLRELTVTFHRSGPVHMWYWPLHLTEGYEPDGDPLIWTASDGYLQEHSFAYRIWPVTALFAHPMNTVVGDAGSDWNLDEHPGEPNVALAELWEMAEQDGFHQYVGMVHPDLNDITTFGGFAGSSDGIATWTIMGNDSDYPWYHASGSTLAHEAAHAYGLQHAPCKIEEGAIEPGEDGGGPVDPLFPGSYGWPDCSLAPTDVEGYYGLDVNWELSGTSGPTILPNLPTAPNAAFPMMSYKGPRWLDPWHGCMLVDVLGVDCVQDEVVPIDTSGPNQGSIPTGTSGGIPVWTCHDVISDVDMCQILPNPSGNPTEDDSDDGTTVATDDWVVTGAVNPDGGTGLLRRALSVPAAEPGSAVAVEPGQGPGLTGDPAAGGPYVLALVDADGVALWATTIDVDDEPSGDLARPSTAGHGAGPDSERWFVERVPQLPGAAKLVLTSPAGDLAELGPSPSEPTLRISEADVGEQLAVTVETGDADGGPVWVTASYRPDEDTAWSPVVPPTVASSFAVDVRDLAGSDDGELRVLATDGFHTVAEVVGGLAVPDQAPQVTIVTPTAARDRAVGRTLDLVAQVFDNEDGELDGDAVEWRSDVDGVVGHGAATEVRDLTEGRHVLSAVATDSTGQSTETTVEVVIGPTDLPPADDQAALAAHLGAPLPGSGGSSAWRTVRAVALAVGVAGAGTALGAFAVRRRQGGEPA